MLVVVVVVLVVVCFVVRHISCVDGNPHAVVGEVFTMVGSVR